MKANFSPKEIMTFLIIKLHKLTPTSISFNCNQLHILLVKFCIVLFFFHVEVSNKK